MNMADQMVSNGKNTAANSSGLSRERSFVRNTNQQNHQNKRRSFAFNQQYQHELQQQQLRAKPAMEIYRPPSKSIEYILKKYTFFLNSLIFSSCHINNFD